jgi:hypothetical protein
MAYSKKEAAKKPGLQRIKDKKKKPGPGKPGFVPGPGQPGSSTRPRPRPGGPKPKPIKRGR